MKLKKMLASAVTAAMAVSGAFAGSMFSANAAGTVKGYENVDKYLADCIISGYISLETGGREDADAGFYNLDDPDLYSYEQTAENIMLDLDVKTPMEGIVLEGSTSEQQVYELLIADYLTNEKNKIKASSNNAELFANKKMKYQDNILEGLVKNGTASSKNEALSLINSSSANDTKKVLAGIKKLSLEKNITAYTKAASALSKTSASADYYDILSSALALAELDEDKIEFLQAVKTASRGSTSISNAIDSSVKAMKDSFADNDISKNESVIANFSVNALWNSVKASLSGNYADADSALDELFDIKDESAGKNRLLLQYVFNGYAKIALSELRSGYDLAKNAAAAENFHSAFQEYVVYQDYSAEYTAEYAEAYSDNVNKMKTESSVFSTENALMNSWYKNFLDYTDAKINDSDIPDGAVEYNGHYYMVFDNSISWIYAKEYCELMNGHLATITDEEEQEKVESVAVSCKTAENFWIGGYLSKKTNEWMWVDDTPFEYEHWDANQPDFHENSEYYIRFTNKDIHYENWTAAKGMWNDCANEASGNNSKGDAVSIQTFAFICEWDSKEDFQSYIPGDANLDGKVNVRDAAHIAKMLATGKVKELSPAADFNGDGKINVRDAAGIAKSLASKK